MSSPLRQIFTINTIIPKLFINMESYPHLVSSQIPHIIYLNTKFVQIYVPHIL